MRSGARGARPPDRSHHTDGYDRCTRGSLLSPATGQSPSPSMSCRARAVFLEQKIFALLQTSPSEPRNRINLSSLRRTFPDSTSKQLFEAGMCKPDSIGPDFRLDLAKHPRQIAARRGVSQSARPVPAPDRAMAQPASGARPIALDAIRESWIRFPCVGRQSAETSQNAQRPLLSHPRGHSRTSLGSRSVYRERSVVGFAR
jgi:hypothetical protein